MIWDFVLQSDTTQIESIQIYGYCDDRGDNDYNYKLSEKSKYRSKNSNGKWI
jgi:outer membrane protein OmpA-like peptidoglycan-associated protein